MGNKKTTSLVGFIIKILVAKISTANSVGENIDCKSRASSAVFQKYQDEGCKTWDLANAVRFQSRV